MKAIATCLARPFSWGGRSGPREFWWFTLLFVGLQVMAIVYLIAPPIRVYLWWQQAMIDGEARAWEQLVPFEPPPFPDVLRPVLVMQQDWILYLSLSILPTFSWVGVTIRRLHDTDHKGWWFWLILIPGVGLALLIVLLIAPGEIHRNRYGAGRGVPKRGTAAAAAEDLSPIDPLAEIEGPEALRALREARMQA